jgi:hypothetical protein
MTRLPTTRWPMTRLLGTAAAIAILGAVGSGAALAQYQAYQPNPYPQTFAQPAPRHGSTITYQEAPAAYPSSGTSQPQYGSSSYQYPPGPGGYWQQSYQLGARPEMSGSIATPPDVVTSSGTTMPNPAYMPSAARYGTDGGIYIPYGSSGR